MFKQKWVLAIMFVALLLTVFRPWQVHAHAVPLQSNPSDGQTLTSSPDQIVVSFSNILNPVGSQLVVYDRKGTRVDRGDCGIASVDPTRKTMVTSLRPDLPPGKYSIYWTTVTDTEDVHDGHVVTGQLEFFIANPPWVKFLQGVGIALGIALVLGGWFAFGFTYRRLRKMEQELAV